MSRRSVVRSIALAVTTLALLLTPLLRPAPLARAGVNSWTRLGPDGGDIAAILIDPQTPATIYAASAYDVWKSTTSGASWQHAGSGLERQQILLLTIDPDTPATLYAGTRDGLYKTTDGGGVWARLDQEFWSPDIYALGLAPSGPARLYVGTAFGIYRSDDHGATWDDVSDTKSA